MDKLKNTMTTAMFVTAHIKAWGKMEFCRVCHGLVYAGTCGNCGVEGGRVHQIYHAKDSLIPRLVTPYLKKIGLMEEPQAIRFGDSTVTTASSNSGSFHVSPLRRYWR